MLFPLYGFGIHTFLSAAPLDGAYTSSFLLPCAILLPITIECEIPVSLLTWKEFTVEWFGSVRFVGRLVGRMSTQLGDDAQYHVLPWWKRIVLDKSFRQNIRRLATSRYREEMRTLEHFPEQLAPVVWDDGKPLSSSSQYICLESDKPWSTRHPQKIVNVSSVRTLHNAAEGFALPSVVKSHEECVKQEMQALFDDERWGDRLYGLSYIWRDQLPPLGFIREWPDPHAAMWPPYLEHGEHDPQDVVAKGYRGGGVRGDNNKGQGQHIVKAMKSFPSQRQVDFLPLLCGVGGVSKGDIYRLGGMNFHNSDNYKLFNAKRIVAEDYAEALSVLPASQRVAVVHKRGEWLLKKLERGGAQQYSRDEEEHESNIAGSVVSSDATVSSTKTVSYSSAGTQREDMKQRHANVDAFDRQQELNRLLKSSLWYRRCCERNHQSVVGTDVLIIRSHTSWDMYQHDTYAIPREKPSDVDNLIAFVQNLPDEFFDEVDSLRMRESIYRSGLDARMGRIADASQPLWAKDGTTPELKTLSLQRAASGSNAHSSDTQSSFIQPTTNNSPRAFSENGMSDPSEVCNSHFVSYLTATLEQQYKVRQEPPKPIIAGHKTAQRERLIKEEEERKERRKETRRMNVRQRLRDRLETEFVRYIESNSKRANLLLAVDRMRGKKA
uniref:Uncharacterized protein n=1 Tax=Trypanosoma vivax (strain Y486) TaxID=1055687 RepID=G0U8D5_TRYVY|nr:conserved hypothetical protein, fragment [Trypanosoma vivax Y486]